MTDKSAEAGRHTGSASRDDYEQELRSSTLAVERDQDKAAKKEMRAAEKEGEAVQAAREKADPDYSPDNPREEDIEREYSGEGMK